ncbi:MAG TPA: ABC transporter permease [Bordetella sp.]|jgi:putative spermidine/putrescine transport system permease protein|nr:ABC transporter permease [Bordetella sp.]
MPAVVLALFSAAFLIAPLLVVVPMSFSTSVSLQFPPPGYWMGYYKAYFSDWGWLMPTINSFVIGAVSALVTMALVIPVSFAYVRRRFRGRALVNQVMMLPLMVPHVVAALGYYGFLSRLHLNGTLLGVIIAHTCLSVPVAFLVLCATLKGFDRNLELAAMSSGAGPLRTFFWVTLPVLRPGLLVALLLSFLQSFNESVVSIFIAGRDASTLPKKMYENIRIDSDPVIAAVSTLLTGLVLVGVLVAQARRTGAARKAA